MLTPIGPPALIVSNPVLMRLYALPVPQAMRPGRPHACWPTLPHPGEVGRPRPPSAGKQKPNNANRDMLDAANWVLRRHNVVTDLKRWLNNNGAGTRVEIYPVDQAGVQESRRRDISHRAINVRGAWDDMVDAWHRGPNDPSAAEMLDVIWDEVITDLGSDCDGPEDGLLGETRTRIRRRAAGLTLDAIDQAVAGAHTDLRAAGRYADAGDESALARAALAYQEWQRIRAEVATTGGTYDPDHDLGLRRGQAAARHRQDIADRAREAAEDARQRTDTAHRRLAGEAADPLYTALARAACPSSSTRLVCLVPRQRTFALPRCQAELSPGCMVARWGRALRARHYRYEGDGNQCRPAVVRVDAGGL